MQDSVFQMQQAARQRVWQAHERARRIVEENNRPFGGTAAMLPRPSAPLTPPRPGPEPPKPCPCVPEPPCREKGDSEVWLLLLLAFLLYHNHSSPEIILALLYLAL